MSKIVKICMYGISGRVGKSIAKLLLSKKYPATLVAAISSAGSKNSGKDVGDLLEQPATGVKISNDITKIANDIDVIIDFSTPEASLELVKHASKPVIVGTTGFSDEQYSELAKFSKNNPLLVSPNMSLGINLLFKLVQDASKTLSEDFKISIEDIHHKHKKDAPSGTALYLEKCAKTGNKSKINIDSKREGEIPGIHSVFFVGSDEKLVLKHEALTRNTFAAGAIKAASWLVNQPPGLYDMMDVLELK